MMPYDFKVFGDPTFNSCAHKTAQRFRVTPFTTNNRSESLPGNAQKLEFKYFETQLFHFLVIFFLIEEIHHCKVVFRKSNGLRDFQDNYQKWNSNIFENKFLHVTAIVLKFQ